jgi:hypothetical protein
VHVTEFEPVHVPFWQVSVCVHPLPSLHAVPLLAVGLEQAPVEGSHVPARWHWSDAVHAMGFEPVHVPFWQESLCVHAFPSLHAVPSGEAGFEHAPVDGSQVPATWH